MVIHGISRNDTAGNGLSIYQVILVLHLLQVYQQVHWYIPLLLCQVMVRVYLWAQIMKLYVSTDYEI